MKEATLPIEARELELFQGAFMPTNYPIDSFSSWLR